MGRKGRARGRGRGRRDEPQAAQAPGSGSEAPPQEQQQQPQEQQQQQEQQAQQQQQAGAGQAPQQNVWAQRQQQQQPAGHQQQQQPPGLQQHQQHQQPGAGQVPQQNVWAQRQQQQQPAGHQQQQQPPGLQQQQEHQQPGAGQVPQQNVWAQRQQQQQPAGHQQQQQPVAGQAPQQNVWAQRQQQFPGLQHDQQPQQQQPQQPVVGDAAVPQQPAGQNVWVQRQHHHQPAAPVSQQQQQSTGAQPPSGQPQNAWAQRQQQQQQQSTGAQPPSGQPQNAWAQQQQQQQQQSTGAQPPSGQPQNAWAQRQQQQQQPAPPVQPQQQESIPQTDQAGNQGMRMGRGRARPTASTPPGQQAAASPLSQPQQTSQPTTGTGDGYAGARPKQGPGYGLGRTDSATQEVVEGVQDMTVSNRMPYDRYITHQYMTPGRSTKGSEGSSMALLTNHFQVKLMDIRLYQYHVDYSPTVENKRVQFGLICSLSAILGDVRVVDGGILYLTRRLDSDPLVAMTTRLHDGAKIRVTFTFKGEVFENSPQFMQIANIVMKRMQQGLGMHQIRDKYFYTGMAVKVDSARLEVIPGFETSIEKFEAGTLLTLDKTHKVIGIDTVLDRISNIYETQRNWKDACYKELLGAIVLTRYNNKTYKISDIAWDKSPSDKFMKNGEEISFVEYYKQHWDANLTSHDQPLLISKPTERDRRRGDNQDVLLVPELCVVTGLPDYVRRNFNLMKDLSVHTRIGPQSRLVALQQFTNEINKQPKACELMKPLGLSISTTPLTVPARQLDNVKVMFEGNKWVEAQEGDFSQKMRNIAMLSSVHMNRWVLICSQRAAGPATNLATCLQRVGRSLGMRILEPVRAQLQIDRNEEYLRVIRELLTPQVQMVVVVVPNDRKDRYDAIKKCCCIDNPVCSQVVKEATLKKNMMSIATKIAIQLNCKMGGEPWGIPMPGQLKMFIGIDTYHDSASKNRSVGAMVASLNTQCTRYYSRTEMHPASSEMMQNLNVLVTGALKKFYEVNRRLPEHIILFRDGVGDSQLETTFKFESEQFWQAFGNIQGYKPKFTFVVVKKRIGTRLFRKDRGSVANPGPGTIVDSHITKQEWYDFFLVSQSVRQGTLTPTSYNVIYDSSDLPASKLQQHTYQLTHLYFNWQGTIRVPAPCQYAHKLAFLQGQSLHREFSAHLTDKLFYL